ncbi:helix-turn-helix domain-containing protein [Ideonella sp. DXS29W]|uniref:Helix-turn-helix domain-containing protein n=1 Tax=Ideonella lacteola TaxID=2984193 RepID=A0ABU9BPD6_9BURK
MSRVSFREQVLRAREDAIVSSVNRLLAQRGYEGMTIDAVAADVGIAKAVLYKHFSSKELLAAAAMVKLLERAQARLDELAATSLGALERLKEVVRWTMRQQLAGEMPALPAQNSSLRSALMSDQAYLGKLMEVSDQLGEWITQAQEQGELDPAFPPELILYTLYARACDPVLAVLKSSGAYTDERITELLLATTFGGLQPRAAAAPEPAKAASEAPRVAHDVA